MLKVKFMSRQYLIIKIKKKIESAKKTTNSDVRNITSFSDSTHIYREKPNKSNFNLSYTAIMLYVKMSNEKYMFG